MRSVWPWVGLCVASAVFGCVKSEVVECEDGSVCPPGDVCTSLGCASAEQLAVCAGMTDGTACSTKATGESVCFDGACIAANCGDGIRAPSEICDGIQFATLGNCTELGYYDDKPLTCTSRCDIDSSKCTGFCGDSSVNGDELCDGDVPAGQSCLDYGRGAGYLKCTSTCGADLSECIAFGWRSIALPAAVYGIHGTSDTNIWVVGFAGMVERFDGSTWMPISVAACTTADLYDVVAISDTEAFVSDDTGVVHITSAGCTKATLPTPDVLWAASPTDVYAGAYNGLWHYNGSTWTMVDANPSRTVWGRSAGDIYRASQSTATLRHYDGVSWSSTTVPGIASIFAVWGDADSVYVSGSDSSNRAVIRRNRLGVWTDSLAQRADLVAGSLARNAVSDGSYNFVVTSSLGFGTILGGDEAGGWTDLTAPYFAGDAALYLTPTRRLYMIDRDSPRVYLYEGSSRRPTTTPPFPIGSLATPGPGAAFTTVSGLFWSWDGVAWTQEGGATDSKDVTSDANGNILVVGSGGVRQRTGPGTFTSPVAVAGTRVRGLSIADFFVQTGTASLTHYNGSPSVATLPANVTDFAHVTSTFAVAVGVGGMIQHWNGGAWNPQASPTTDTLYAVAAASDNDIYALGNHVIVHYDGVSWTSFSTPTTDPLRSVVGRTGDLFVATGYGAFHHDGTRWTPVDTGGAASIDAMAMRGSSVFWVAANFGIELFRSLPW